MIKYEPVAIIEFQGTVRVTGESNGHYICDIKREIFVIVFIFTILFKGISFVKQFSSFIYFAREARVDRRSRACEAKLRSCKRGSRAV